MWEKYCWTCPSTDIFTVYKTGKYIYEKCAGKMVPCQLKMGVRSVICGGRYHRYKAVAGTADGIL
jgi:hypothetical protein